MWSCSSPKAASALALRGNLNSHNEHNCKLPRQVVFRVRYSTAPEQWLLIAVDTPMLTDVSTESSSADFPRQLIAIGSEEE